MYVLWVGNYIDISVHFMRLSTIIVIVIIIIVIMVVIHVSKLGKIRRVNYPNTYKNVLTSSRNYFH